MLTEGTASLSDEIIFIRPCVILNEKKNIYIYPVKKQVDHATLSSSGHRRKNHYTGQE